MTAIIAIKKNTCCSRKTKKTTVPMAKKGIKQIGLTWNNAVEELKIELF